MNGVGGRVQILRGVVLAAALASACGDARPPDLLLDDRCDDCRLLLEPLAILAGDGRNVVILPNTKLATTATGRYIAAPLADRARVAVFAGDGALLGMVGTRGPGPGELENVTGSFTMAGDSLFVVQADGAVEVFDAAGTAVRSFFSPVEPFRIRESPTGDLVLSAAGGSAGLLIADREGNPLGTLVEPDRESAVVRSRDVHVDGEGTIWSLLSDYRIHAFDGSGANLGSWRGDLEGIVTVPEGGSRYLAQALEVIVPEPGMLHVLLLRRDLEWRPRSSAGLLPGRAPLMLTVDEAREAYRYYLDVIDLERGRLSGRLAIEDRFVGGLLDGNRIYTLEAGADHEMYIQVWRVRLIGATPTNAYGARTASPPLTSDDPQYSRGGSPG